MYVLNEKGLFHNGRRVPRMLHYDDAPTGVNQDLLDLLCDYFKGDIEPERRALAIYQKAPALFTRLIHNESSAISDTELEEMIVTVLIGCHEERETNIEIISGCRRDTLRLQ